VGERVASRLQGVHTPLLPEYRPAVDAARPYFTDWRRVDVRPAESAMHSRGVSLRAQQALLGHSNPKMTLAHAETDEAANRHAVKELGSLFLPRFSQVATSLATGTVN